MLPQENTHELVNKDLPALMLAITSLREEGEKFLQSVQNAIGAYTALDTCVVDFSTEIVETTKIFVLPSDTPESSPTKMPVTIWQRPRRSASSLSKNPSIKGKVT